MGKEIVKLAERCKHINTYIHVLICCLARIIAAILVLIFCDFLMIYQIFPSPQVKEIKIISNENGIYELPHDLLDNFRLRILGN